MNIQQVKWAKQHDWFVESIMIDGELNVQASADEFDCNGDIVGVDCICTSDFQELRQWAGY